MKKVWICSILGLAMMVTACNDEQVDSPVSFEEEEIQVTEDASMDESFDEVDDLTTTSMDLYLSDGGRVASDNRFDCVEVTKEEGKITLDFGDGCEGPYGRIRKGIIEITYTGRYWEPGSVITTTLIDFYLDSAQVEGTRTVTNLAESLEDTLVFSVVLTGGKVTWPDGTFATREVNRTRTWYRGANPLADEVHIEGTANGQNRNGANYTCEILEPIVFKRDCRRFRKFYPVSGVKQIITDNHEILINFGDGECNNTAILTVDGVSKEITLNPKRFRRI